MAAEILEACMVVAFGISWPLNIIKSVRTRSAKGKSMLFLIFILVGYVCGIVGKIVGGNITWVFAFYVLNAVMVSTDMVLTVLNKRRDERLAAAAVAEPATEESATEESAPEATDGAEQSAPPEEQEGADNKKDEN